MSNQSISLYFREGTSDKVYEVDLISQGGGYVVNFRNGRRGGPLKSGTKTDSPVPLEEARDIYDKLVKAKTAKGYSPGAAGVAYQATSLEERVTGFQPQLLNAIKTEAQLEEYLLDNAYVAQEKLNGWRTFLRRKGSNVEGANRRGLRIALPQNIVEAALALDEDQFAIDGELIGTVFHAFDLLELNGADKRAVPYRARDSLLSGLLVRSSACLRAVPVVSGGKDKRALLKRIIADRGEGVVFKLAEAPYTPGRPASGGSQMKYKLVETATARVVKQNAGKRSVVLQMHDASGEWVSVGSVTIPANHPIPPAGALVDIDYLYAHEGGSLFQPVYKGIRTDLLPEAASVSQLKYKPATEEDEG